MDNDEIQKVVQTVANRVKSDVTVKVKLSTSIGDLNSEDIEVPALKTVLNLFKNHLEEVVRRPVYHKLRELLKDHEAISIHLQNKGFSIDQLHIELEALKYIMTPVEFQPSEPELTLSTYSDTQLTLTDEGFDEVPLPNIEEYELPILKFNPSLSFVSEGLSLPEAQNTPVEESGTGITLDDDGNPVNLN